MKITDPDGNKWRVGRRIFPWSLRRPRYFTLPFAAVDLEEIGCLLALIGLIPMSIYWLFKAALGLLITPLLLLCDVLHLRRRRVVAFRIEIGFVGKVVEWRRLVRSRMEVRQVREAAADLLSRSFPHDWGVRERLAYLDGRAAPAQPASPPPQGDQCGRPTSPPPSRQPGQTPSPNSPAPRSAVQRRDQR